ncbi:MAG: hypothetical protein JWP01_3570 [Myxococcales bacterium]|nr:hypothetical protein [Myxococcales bacterium]
MIVICTSVLGCTIRKRQPEAEPVAAEPKDAAPPAHSLSPEQLAGLRAEVIAGSTVLGRAELTPTDPAIVDPCITKSLVDGAFPATPKQRTDLMWHATTCLTGWLSYKEDGLAYLNQRIADRYANPVITRDGDLVRIDAGVVPGKVSVFRARLQVMTSPLIEQGELIGTEVAKLLELGMKRHPDARTYQLEVDIPATWSKGTWTHVFDRTADRVRVYSGDWSTKYYETERLGGDLGKLSSLHHTNLTEHPLDGWVHVPVRGARP